MKADDLKRIRREAGIKTQSQLAGMLGTGWTKDFIGAIESGLIGIDEETYDLIKSRIKQYAGRGVDRREEVLA